MSNTIIEKSDNKEEPLGIIPGVGAGLITAGVGTISAFVINGYNHNTLQKKIYNLADTVFQAKFNKTYDQVQDEILQMAKEAGKDIYHDGDFIELNQEKLIKPYGDIFKEQENIVKNQRNIVQIIAITGTALVCAALVAVGVKKWREHQASNAEIQPVADNIAEDKTNTSEIKPATDHIAKNSPAVKPQMQLTTSQ